MSALATLIAIYARQPAASVAGDPEYVQLCMLKDGDPVFHHERDRVERVKQELEQSVGIQISYQKQVRFALRCYARLLGDGLQKDEICLQLARHAYSARWSETQRSYFDSTVVALRDGQDYFLSFTQRNPGGGGNPINSTHRHLIENLGVLNPADSTKNLLAQGLYHFLRQGHLKGFYFPVHEDDSGEVGKKLNDALRKARVFIQLVQNEMFSKDYDSSRNYCHDEYQKAVAQQKKMIYIFADGQHPDDLLQEDLAHFDLDAWYECMRNVDCLSLDSTLIYNENVIAKNRQKLKAKLEAQLHGYRRELWENVPQDLS